MTLETLLAQSMNEKLIDIIISNPRSKDGVAKIKIRPVAARDELVFQATEYVGTKVLHSNYQQEEIAAKIEAWLTKDFKQAQIVTQELYATVLSGKSGNITIKCKQNTVVDRKQAVLSHNREKQYILKEGTPVAFLVDLGVMTKEGRIVRQRYDKFKQINRFLEFIEDILPQLDKTKKQTIIDFGCGKSYLTFAMYYYLRELKGYDIRVIGLDLKTDVIEKCNALKEQYGYDELNFCQGDIASYTDVDSVDMVVTLHACDTATDYALAKAVQWGAKVILSVPCCQHEANSMIENELLQPVFRYGIIKERMAALMTDAIRADILEQHGYKAQILEFIDLEHTPKNLLIRAVKAKKVANSENSSAQLRTMEEAFGLQLTLNRLLDKFE